jgi:hypothetical protein
MWKAALIVLFTAGSVMHNPLGWLKLVSTKDIGERD